MRLIDADALKEQIENCNCKNCNHYNFVRCRACWIDDAVTYIDDAPTAEDINVPSKWISVKEKLPDDASDVLAYYDDGTESRTIPANYYKRCWYDCVFNRPISDLKSGFIKYWMPSPKPPEEVKQAE